MRKLMVMAGIVLTLAMTTGCGSQKQEAANIAETQNQETSNTAEAQEQETTDKTEAQTENIEETTTTEQTDIEENDAAETDNEDASETESSDQTEAVSDTHETPGSNILVAYFSWSGNTKTIAEMIAEETGADLFEIVPSVPYTEDYDAVVDQAQEEQSEGARPEIADTVENFDSYDTVFIGYPNWWSDVPMIINTFLESYDFSGKTVIPFCTHGGGGFGNSISSITNGAQGATILEGFATSGSSVDSAQEKVQTWLASLNLQ